MFLITPPHKRSLRKNSDQRSKQPKCDNGRPVFFLYILWVNKKKTRFSVYFLSLFKTQAFALVHVKREFLFSCLEYTVDLHDCVYFCHFLKARFCARARKSVSFCFLFLHSREYFLKTTQRFLFSTSISLLSFWCVDFFSYINFLYITQKTTPTKDGKINFFLRAKRG